MQNETTDLESLTKSAKEGNAAAQNLLGGYYYKGIGIKRDYEQAEYWYKLSAANGNTSAKYNLGSYYYNGKGVEKTPELAKYWFRQAAKEGNSGAKDALTKIEILEKKKLATTTSERKQAKNISHRGRIISERCRPNSSLKTIPER